eukprot:TRINITY_DN27398_c1_g1_i1.p1 TRINITY_DN27398_c1_g1~~TRINITY_DN27398_c1_g1_i1.p1  ORF type:complete len:410 (-),score=112.26 TRINITY_DN27398_c1_g1_i1:57-1286(-)
MAAGARVNKKKRKRDSDDAEEEVALVAEAQKKWVERPFEPIVANGRGMRVLGFVPVGGLVTKPLHPSASTTGAASSNTDPNKGGATSSAAPAPGSKPEGGGTVEGPTFWKRSRPVYAHGNYGRYYGYRHADTEAGSSDQRLVAIKGRLGKKFFKNKEVLDIGCNAGLVSLAVAHHFGARRVVGMDIDKNLIQAADANLASRSEAQSLRDTGGEVEFRAEDILFSSLKKPPDNKPERFDVVLCLSVTKWVHFAYGDPGVRNLFKRIFKRLRPGGVFVLEPQEWSSYKKKRHITPEIRSMVAGIEMRPSDFDEYLLSIGFEKLEVIEPTSDAPLNFQRSLRLFRRPAKQEQDEDGPSTADCPEPDVASEQPAKVSKKNAKQLLGATDKEVEDEEAGEVQKKKKKKEKNVDR